MSTATKQDVFAFMQERFLCVISTVGENAKPEAAMVAYTASENLQIMVGTSNKSRKYQNILQNSSVAVVIADQTGEVQYEGEAEILTSADYESLLAVGQFQKLAGYDKYRDDPTQVYLKLTPTWIRFIVHGPPGAGEDQITEFTEF
jgi:nitroimidazol reductase NimA-like FMN-containing flavoprotein (pyridoxamine 5'-phosphate oxidase superfamily)